MKKLFITTVLLSILLCLVMGLNANAATIVESGSCGTNVTYTLDSDGVLTISGSGAMTNYSIGSAPWYSSRSSIKTVIIKTGVTSIGEHAFFLCSSLTNITIPESVTSIGGDAFRNCSSLTSITIPNSVTSIDYGTFMYCYSLTSVTIPDSVTSIDDSTFYGCSSLTSITIPNSVTNIGWCVFEDCSSLTSITLHSKECFIGSKAFGSTNLTDIYYIGSEEEWLEGVFVSSDNDEFTSATVHYNTPVVLTGLELDKTELNLAGSESYTFTVTLFPSYAPASQLVWSSSNTEVATVDQSGKVKALKDGTAVIKVTTEDGSYSAVCVVKVNTVIDIKTTSIAAGGTKANITFAITWGDVECGTLFVGVYDDKGILTGMGCVDLTNATTSIKVPVYYPAKPKTYKAFMWNNPTDMEPVLDMCEGSF